MYRLLVEKQWRQLPYYLCTGLALGLSHEKTVWEKQRFREWWTDIVKGNLVMTNGWKIFEGQQPLSRFCVMIRVLVFLTRLDPYGSNFNRITELLLLCTRCPLLRNTVLLPICLVLENQQYINASMMSAQQWLRIFWTNMQNSLQMMIWNMSLMV